MPLEICSGRLRDAGEKENRQKSPPVSATESLHWIRVPGGNSEFKSKYLRKVTSSHSFELVHKVSVYFSARVTKDQKSQKSQMEQGSAINSAQYLAFHTDLSASNAEILSS